MQLSKADLTHIAEALEIRFTYLQKMTDPSMGLQLDIVRKAKAEMEEISPLHYRICEELRKLNPPLPC